MISLDAGLRMDGIPALDLWDLIVAVLGNTNQSHKEQGDLLMNERKVRLPPHTIQKRKKIHGKIDDQDNVDFLSSNVQSSHKEALLYVFEDNEAVIKMIIKGRSPTMRHISRTHRVALDWLFDRINLDSKIQIKYIDTKNQLADMLTKGNFTRDEWNHLLCLFNISHFSSTDCSEVMSKRTQKESGEERVTAKSRPMMSLLGRAPSTLSSSASESPVKRSYESQSPWSAKAEEYDRTVKPVVGRDTSHAPGHHHKQFVKSSHSAGYSGWDHDKAWSSQEWKADELMDDRTGHPLFALGQGHTSFNHVSLVNTSTSFLKKEKPHDRTEQPVVCPQRGARPQQFIIGDDETEIELSVESSAFLNKVNDQVRKRQTRSPMNVTENDEKHSVIWGMFMSVTLESAVASHQEYKRSHNETNVRHICEIGVRTR